MELPHIANFRSQIFFFDGAQMLNQSASDRAIVLIWFYQQRRQIHAVAVGAFLWTAFFPLYLHVIKTPGIGHWF